MKRTRSSLNKVCASAFAVIFSAISVCSHSRSDETDVPSDQPVVVEKSMHDFMAYVFQPSYKRLKIGMATEPADRKAWRAVLGDVLTLAEANNLLLHRTPEKDVAAWLKISAASRDEGGKLYQAAKQGSYTDAKVHYSAMLIQCNACHTQFAEGKHQLQP
ncbi:MAG: hypothetical protein SGI77_01440 [Pirellulaceae bacterium]|nr:hypothetical protein [Pirellulaceae bacterium]